MKLRAIVTLEYEANPDHYGTDDPQKMVELDTGPNGDLAALLQDAESCTIVGEEVV